MMYISICICTHNRAEMLAETLASFAEQHGSCRAPFELLVVDNNSTDSTEAVTAKFVQCHPQLRVRYICESRQGLSHARNRAAAEATGEIVVYCDDDVFFDSNLVDAYSDAFQFDSTLAAVAGRINPYFEAPRPAWLTDKMLGPYGITTFGGVPRMLDAGEKPVGANMAIKREHVISSGGFSPKLGRDGRTLLSNEEVLFFAQLRQNGGKIAYLPAAHLRHRVPAQRLSQDWLIKRHFWQGISDAVVEAEAPSFSRSATLHGAWGDLRKVLRMVRPRTASPRAWYWQIRRPGMAIGPDLAYLWGRARGRLKVALARRHD